jgi:8-oxo-dGTP pyrophosphatase MutT (NUDIX family)
MRAMPNRWKPNVTVAAIVEHDGRFLIVEEETADGLRLNNPAGHLDPGESPLQACVREVLEETAYDFEPQGLVGMYLNRFTRTRTGDDITYLRFAFYGRVGTHHGWRTLDDGIVRAFWLTLDELRACRERHRSPLLLQCIEDYLAGQRAPLALIHTDTSVLQAPAPRMAKA